MNRRLSRGFRALMRSATAVTIYTLVFLALEGGLIYLERLGGLDFKDARLRVGAFILAMGCVVLGLARVIGTHPCFNDDYRGWLSSSPWTNRKPLPMGPVEFEWADVVLVGILLLVGKLLPVPISPWLVDAWLMANLAPLAVSFWLTRMSAFGYLTALGLGFAVLSIRLPYVSLAILAATYLVAYEGLKRSLDAFPWAPRTIPNFNQTPEEAVRENGQLGWPYERMLRQLVAFRGISRADAILSTLLAAFWIYVLASLDPDGRRLNRPMSVLPLTLVAILAPPFRLLVYTQGYNSPLSLLGRLGALRLIIPRYDVVFLTPICCDLAGLLVFLALWRWVPLDILFPIVTAVIVLVALLGPPSLRKWRLTGGHNMAPVNEKNKSLFVEAG